MKAALLILAAVFIYRATPAAAQEMTTFDYLLGFLEEECGCFPGGVTLVDAKKECKALLAKTANKVAVRHEKMIFAMIRHLKEIGALSAEQSQTIRSMIPHCPPPNP